MKLTELESPTTPAEAIGELDAESIHIARLTPQPTPGSAAAEITKPPAVVFVTDQRRPVRGNPRAALALIAAVIATALVWALIASSTASSSGGSHKAAVHLTPAQQRAAAAARVRAAAIAKATRDRGTDAQWGDTTPGVTPAPSSAPNATLPPAGPATP